jgi:hypothetical protein
MFYLVRFVQSLADESLKHVVAHIAAADAEDVNAIKTALVRQPA